MMNVTFKEFLLNEGGLNSGNDSVKVDGYNWARNPLNWTDVKDNEKIEIKDVPKNVKSITARTLWGKRNPKPSEDVQRDIDRIYVTVKIKDAAYLLHKVGDTLNVKRIVPNIKSPTDPSRSIGLKNWKEAPRIDKTSANFANVVRLNVDGLWKQGMAATPDAPFDGRDVRDGWPADFKGNKFKTFRTTVRNNHYLVKLGKTPNDRTIAQII